MTIAELNRYFTSKARMRKQEAQERASYDYILADLIGRSNARLHSKQAKFPEIYDVYSSLFSSEEIEAKRKEKEIELFTLRFREFANFHNSKIGGGNKP